ncbi:hypothetical protein TNCV_853261 [Trichonephila clavipes]|nr:hypothetical protein TNCV_853261 [Trichonephila clavipes]
MVFGFGARNLIKAEQIREMKKERFRSEKHMGYQHFRAKAEIVVVACPHWPAVLYQVHITSYTLKKSNTAARDCQLNPA